MLLFEAAKFAREYKPFIAMYSLILFINTVQLLCDYLRSQYKKYFTLVKSIMQLIHVLWWSLSRDFHVTLHAIVTMSGVDPTMANVADLGIIIQVFVISETDSTLLFIHYLIIYYLR